MRKRDDIEGRNTVHTILANTYHANPQKDMQASLSGESHNKDPIVMRCPVCDENAVGLKKTTLLTFSKYLLVDLTILKREILYILY